MVKPKIKLTYFNAKGLSEGIRFILAYADAEFEDVRIEKEDWPAMKESEHKFNNVNEIISYEKSNFKYSLTPSRYYQKRKSIFQHVAPVSML